MEVNLSISGNSDVLIKHMQDSNITINNDTLTADNRLSGQNIMFSEPNAIIIHHLEVSDNKTQQFTNVKETDFKILLELEDSDIFNICKVSKYTTKLCSDDYFWKLRIKHIYGVDLHKYKGQKTYKEIYKELKYIQDKNILKYVSGEGYIPLVKKLIDIGDDNHDLGEALIESSKYGHIYVVKYLVENGADIHVYADEPLRLASERGHLEVVKYLIENGADIHVYADGPLRLASERGHLEVVKYLIEHGAIRANRYFDYALRGAIRHGYIDVVKYLIENDNNWEFAFIWAAEYGQIELVKYLIDSGTVIDIATQGDANLAFIDASAGGELEIVDYLANLDSLSSMCVNIIYNAIISASEYGQLEVVKYLLEKCVPDVHIHAHNQYLARALKMASENAELEVEKYLIENGANNLIL